MNLISCAKCGTVLDKNKISQPNILTESRELIESQAAWSDDDEYEATINCPSCKSRIFYRTGDLV